MNEVVKGETKENSENRFCAALNKLRRNVIVKILVLFFCCMFVTAISFKYSVGKLGEIMYNSYFENKVILILNFLPVFWLAMFIFAISNKVSISYLITSCTFHILTLINYFKMALRDDNLLMEDITLIREALTIKTNYTFEISKGMVGYLLIFIMMSIAMFFVFDRKNKIKDKLQKEIVSKKKVVFKVLMRVIASVAVLVIGVVGLNTIYVDEEYYQKTKNDEGGYFNIWSSINQYISRGTIYSFLHSYTAMKKTPPEGYKKEEAKAELEKYTYSNIPEDKKVNVISVMFEAYNDFSRFEQIEFNIDPYKKLHEIEEESYAGELITNIFAGGTVDTERKFITGYTDLPTLRQKTNSYVYYFKEQGYTVEGSHSCYEWFYNRVNINRNLGFDNYYFYENKYSQLADGAIAADNILLPEIVNLYRENKKSSKPYFSFNVTYQNHGPYTTEKAYDKEYVVKKENYTDAEYNILNNYLQGIEDTTNNIYNMLQ